MAPNNEYLSDGNVQRQLAAHDNRLIKSTTLQFPGEEPEIHWDFNRAKELELLSSFLDRQTEDDYQAGRVTVTDAVQAAYGIVDGYLTDRVARTHLHPASAFNKAAGNGLATVVAPDGTTIMREDLVALARRELQIADDRVQQRMTRAATSSGRSLNAAEKRARRIAPDAKPELTAFVAQTRDAVINVAVKALGTGEQS